MKEIKIIIFLFYKSIIQIKILLDRLKNAESRAEYGEKTVQKLSLFVGSTAWPLLGYHGGKPKGEQQGFPSLRRGPY